jgi:fibronectin-binding autotransporter adhesin
MQNPIRIPARNRSALALGVLLGSVISPLFAQQTFYFDENGATAGLGNYPPNRNWIGFTWSSTLAGDAASVAWDNLASPPNHAVFDLTATTIAASTININGDINVGNITVQNYTVNQTTGLAISTPAGAASRTFAFGAGSVISVEDMTNATDLTIRSFNNTTATTSALNFSGGFTKTGAGRLAIVAQSGAAAGNNANATMNLGSGTFTVSQGALFLFANGTGASADTSRTITANGATFVLAAGTDLTFDRPLSWSGGTVPTSGAVDLGVIGGAGTVRGDAGGTNSLTVSITGARPGDLGAVDTLTVADGVATGSTAFTFASIATGGLKFDLAAPGSSDVLAFSGISTVDLAGLAFSDFDFNQLAGFGAGTYTLMSDLTSVGGSFGLTTGTIGAFDATLSLSGNDVILTTVAAIPEPSAFAGLAGLAVLGLVAARRRSRA